MTRFLLVRHAAHDDVGRFLAGRMPGVHLGPAGLEQAARLGVRLRNESPSLVYASPRERTQETASAIASACGIQPVRTDPALDEIDFGSWSGRTFDELNQDWEWRRWNEVRSLADTPAGETMADVQARAVGLIRRVHGEEGDATVALVSHADVIKAVICFYLGLSIDAWAKFEIAPASITTLVLGPWSAMITGLNERGG